MSSESHLPTVPILEDSPISAIPTSESATAEENRILRLRMMEIWDAWSNGREPPTTIPGFPELLPRASFKTPKFEKYGGHGDPIAHLKRYYNQLRGVGGKAELLMAYFGESLVGIASEWNSLSNLKKKSSESFREYAVKWHEQTARVKPPIDEIEMVNVFLQAQEDDYFQNMMSAMGKPFAEAIKIGEIVENGLKPGRILSQSAIRATSQAIQGGSGGVANRKKKEEVAMATSSVRKPRPPRPYFPARTPQYYYPYQDVAYAMVPQPYTVMNAQPYNKSGSVLKDEDIPNVTNNPLPAHNNGLVIGMICEDKEFDPALKAIIAIADVERKPKAVAKQDKGEKKSKPTPQNTEKKVETKTGAAPSKDVILYVPRGHMKEQMSLSPPRRFELNKRFKMKLGEANETNPVEKYLNLEEVNKATKKSFPLKKPVSAEEAEEFFRKMKTADYEIIDQLRKSPAQVSLLSLLMNSTEHQKVLIKPLNEADVPIETTVEQLERIAERFFAINQISFSKNDLPPERAAHNKALYLTVKCEGYYVKRVMIDGRSGFDIALSQLCKEWRLGLRESGLTTSVCMPLMASREIP
ncbi:uncharacterized protein [Nicotiana sylvestris]|uniref:uncharacterized protein n=1 Tax=Nicotiana sylvestris TaxID=4096 RepID=UPI00388C545E